MAIRVEASMKRAIFVKFSHVEALAWLAVAVPVGAGAAQAQGAAPTGPRAADCRASPGCHSPAVAGVATPPGYVIGPDDALAIVFWREKELSADVVVRPDGMISLPLINDVRAEGLTPEQLRVALTRPRRSSSKSRR